MFGILLILFNKGSLDILILIINGLSRTAALTEETGEFLR